MSEPPVVAHNRFPTVLVEPGGATWREARTVITCPAGDTPARLLVWLHPDGPIVEADIDLDASTIGAPRHAWQLATPAGVYEVRPGRGCGCGNRLKHMQLPWSPVRMGRLP